MVKKVLFLWMLVVSLNSVKAGDVYVKVTSPEQLIVGAEYILAAQTGSGDTYVATSYDDNSCLTTTNKGFTSDDAVITIDTANPLVFELGGGSEDYTLKLGLSYLSWQSKSADLQLNQNQSNNENVLWTYTYDEEYETYFIKGVSTSERILALHTQYYIKAYSTNSIKNGLPPVHLYKKVTEKITAVSSNDEWGAVSITNNVIEATPNEGYRISKSEPYEVEGKAKVTRDGNKFVVVPSEDCIIRINFEEIPIHTVRWNVNGVVSKTEVAEDEEIRFEEPMNNIPFGYVFKGWSDFKIGIPQEQSPVYTTSAIMGTTDVTYYAVFAIPFDDECIVTLTAKETTITSKTERTLTDDNGNIWKADCATDPKDNMSLYLFNGTDAYLESPEFSGAIVGISILAYGGNSDRKFSIKYSKDAVENISSVLVPKDEKATNELTFDISDVESFCKFFMKAESALRLHRIKVTYAIVGYRNYCTSVSIIETVTLSSACTDGTKYYGTYSSGSAFVVPSDLTVSEIQVEDDKLVIRNYGTGDVVPANRGVMVSSTEPGEHAVVLSDQEGKALLGDENCLYPSGDEGITDDEMAEVHPNSVYYRLTMHGGETLGFYWGANEGGTFYLDANKAYLAIPNGQASRISGFNLVDNEMTSIRVLPVERTDDTMYNLYGQRVSDNAKGIVIKNGKKLIKR